MWVVDDFPVGKSNYFASCLYGTTQHCVFFCAPSFLARVFKLWAGEGEAPAEPPKWPEDRLRRSFALPDRVPHRILKTRSYRQQPGPLAAGT